MSKILFRPLALWPGKPTPLRDRKSGLFRVTASRALEDCEHELFLQGAPRESFLELDVPDRDVRNDGRLRADARPLRGPGVVLYFEHPTQGTLRFASDQYHVWYHNLRGITLTLEALRSVERHGAVQDAAQFRGFKALPASTALTMGRTAALAILEEYAWKLRADADPHEIRQAYLTARNLTHPDRNNGERAAFDRVQSAGRELGVPGA